jgi:hypothetical protein
MSILTESMRETSFGVSSKNIPEAQRIDVCDKTQVTHWCRLFGATPLELFTAIEKVGSEVAAVRYEMRTR